MKEMRYNMDESKLIKNICDELAKLFSCPCNFSPMDEIMGESGICENDCGTIHDSECWYRYFKIRGLIPDSQKTEI